MKRILHSGYTGIRTGETVISTPYSKQNAGSEMLVRVVGSVVALPPSTKYVDNIEYSEARDVVRDIPFFGKMTTEQALEWLEANKQKGDVYISDVRGIEVKFRSISGTDMMRMPEDVRSDLLQSDRYVPLSRIYDYFNKPGSSKNLIFRPSNWMVKIENETVQFTGTLLTLTDDDVMWSEYSGELEGASVAGDLAVSYTPSDASEVAYDAYVVRGQLVGAMQRAATPSLHKSIIQKIIRTRTSTVEFLGMSMSGRDALQTSLALLMQHPGVLNTNIHPPVFETGLQSALKRLAVSIAEDSYTTEESLLFLFSGALYAKLNRTWTPTTAFVDRVMDIALTAYEEERCYDYNISANHTPRDNVYGLCLDILTSLGSLKSDLPMVASISHYNGKARSPYRGPDPKRADISLAHAVDMHNITDIAWMIPRSTFKSYPELFKQIWERSSSANPRKGIYVTRDAFTDNLLVAQTFALYLRAYQKASRTPDPSSETVELEYTLHSSWFAAEVGPIPAKLASGRAVTIVLNTDNMADMYVTVIPKLSRGEKEYTITAEDNEDCRVLIVEMLEAGVRAGGKRLSMRDGAFYVDGVQWEEYSIQTSQVPVCVTLEGRMVNAVAFSGHFIERAHLENIDICIASLSTAETSRVLMYLSSFSSKIELRKIDRRGGSSTYQVSPDDTSVFRFLCEICIIAPCALELTAAAFEVRDQVAWSSIRDYILSALRSRGSGEGSDWPAIDTSDVQLFEHQESALKQCIASYNGKSIINMTPGLGKTRIVIHYITWLIQSGLMPAYCIYTLPPSAMKGVVDQFLEYDIEVNLLDYATSSKTYNAVIEPGCVNFIKHDHMRLGSFMDDAREITSSLFFVVDEFHLTLLDTTQRTSDAIELATSARYTIAMTGTMMHNKMELLVPWLRLICRFEATKKNFLVAVGQVISSRVVTSVEVDRVSVDIPLSQEQRKEHDSSFEAALRLCYRLVNAEIVRLTLELVESGTGVFIVAKDIASQEWIRDRLVESGVTAIELISNANPVDYKPTTRPKLSAIITTARHSTGYTITGMHTMITSVYFGSQASREQLDMRLNRIGQPSKVLTYYTVHCGILTRVMERYDRIKSVADAMKEFASIVR